MTNRRQCLGSVAALGAASLVPGAAGARRGKALTIAQERGYLRDAGFNAMLTPIVARQDAMAQRAQGKNRGWLGNAGATSGYPRCRTRS